MNKLTNYRKVHHLSHIDLDGFGCTVQTYHMDNTVHYNGNYGGEVQTHLDTIFTEVKKDNNELILVTDLFLNTPQCEALDALYRDGVDVAVIDHHPVSSDMLDKYEWYVYDNTISATLGLFRWLGEEGERFEQLSTVISDYDIFNKSTPESKGRWSVGAMINDLWFSRTRDLDNTSSIMREVTVGFLKGTAYNVDLGRCDHRILEMRLQEIMWQSLANSTGDPTSTKSTSELFVDLVADDIVSTTDKYVIDGYTVLVATSMPQHSVMANAILENHDNIDIVMKVSLRQGTVSLRALQGSGINVAEISLLYFHGNGHMCAAGGKTSALKAESVAEAMANFGFIRKEEI